MKENFKKFVKSNPKLINYVKNNNISWQKLYEIYCLYGEDENVWNKYILDTNKNFDDLLDLLKNINLESIKNTVEGLQKVISIIQDFSFNKSEQETYSKRKEYQNLDD